MIALYPKCFYYCATITTVMASSSRTICTYLLDDCSHTSAVFTILTIFACRITAIVVAVVTVPGHSVFISNKILSLNNKHIYTIITTVLLISSNTLNILITLLLL